MCPVVAAAWRAASTRMSASSNWRNATIVSAAWSGVSIARSSKASSALSLAVTRSRALTEELRQVGMSSVRRKESGVYLTVKPGIGNTGPLRVAVAWVSMLSRFASPPVL